MLDAQFWFRQNQEDHRAADGIHWNAKAHRWLTCIFLSHISEAWGIGYPEMISRGDLPSKADDVINDNNGKKTNIKKREVISFEEEFETTTKRMRSDLQIPDTIPDK